MPHWSKNPFNLRQLYFFSVKIKMEKKDNVLHNKHIYLLDS